MKPAVLISPEPVPDLVRFVEAPTSSSRASSRKPRAKPAPFKVRWLRQIASVRGLPGLAVQTAILLAEYYNDEAGCSWPSQARLTDELNATRNGVRQAIKRLEDAGLIEYIPERGRAKNNRYFLRFPGGENGN